ncbi:MAG: hypothetical protein C5B52_06630 [Bacteroidetes bacterium]|nr:MAG: hypothetical protein C5B52_06630 [Bacteroidota bacterium]
MIGFLILSAGTAMSQTDFDAIMMNKSQFCNGLIFDHASWDHYWEGTLKRDNQNLGTVSTNSVMYMGAYGITNDLNVLLSAPYVWTKASAGTLHGLDGVQDISLMVKWRALKYAWGKSKLSVFALGGFSTPLTNYVIDFLPLSIGLGSTNLTGRAMVDYQWKRWTATGSSSYIARSNVKLDRTSYYDTQLHSTNEVKMPDALQSQLRLGYRGKYLIAEALVSNWTTLGGFDITRNNMPFPSNRMNSTAVGANVKYTLKRFTNLSFIAGGDYTVAGRNVGQNMAFHGGAFYAFYFSKKDKPKNVSTY